VTPLLLEVKGLRGGYGDTLIVAGIDLAVRAGETVGLLGRNGVGKSTLLKLITGYLPRGDCVRWLGSPLPAGQPHRLARLGVAVAPQEQVVFDDLTVHENLNLTGETRPHLPLLLKSFPRLVERRRQRAGTLSGGEKKLVSFTRCLSQAAKLTVLDEPTEGVQQENLELMAKHILRKRDRGSSFLIADQNLTFLQAVATQVSVMDHGEIVYRSDGRDRDRLERFLYV
jgi:ABC-type branched-subunit amino acid transport system ATPase component